jgi:hypothetical protein
VLGQLAHYSLCTYCTLRSRVNCPCPRGSISIREINMKNEWKFTPKKGLTVHYYPKTREFSIVDSSKGIREQDIPSVSFSKAMGKRLANWITGISTCERFD